MHEAIGTQVRTLRQQLGMTQAQLAGDGISRAYLSMIESGKARPSLQTLSILAERLGRPLTYLVKPTGTAAQAIQRGLLEEAERCLNTLHLVHAVELSQQALEMALSWGDILDEANAKVLVTRALLRMQEVEQAQPYIHWLHQYAPSINCMDITAESMLLDAELTSALEQNRLALLKYQQAAQFCTGRKRLAEKAAEVRLGMGSCHMGLGQYGAAKEDFSTVVTLLNTCGSIHYGRALLGLAAAQTALGHLSDAYQAAAEAERIFLQHGGPIVTDAQCQISLIELAKGYTSNGETGLMNCLASYQRQNRPGSSASVLGWVADLLQKQGKLDQAETYCHEALQLVAHGRYALVRARMFLTLALINEAHGRHEKSQAYRIVAKELFRSIDAEMEVETTEQAARSLLWIII